MLKEISVSDRQESDPGGKTYNASIEFKFSDGFYAGCRFERCMHPSHRADTKQMVADALRQLANEIEGGSGGRFYSSTKGG